MPAVQYESSLSKTTEISHFLSDCQQQAIATHQPKLASLSIPIDPIKPWEALAALGNSAQHHFYYDRPDQSSLVGIAVAIDFWSEGKERFAQAQDFIQQWRSQVIFQDLSSKPSQRAKLHFLCSSTFFEQTTTNFRPIHVFVPQVQIATNPLTSTVTFNYLISARTDLQSTESEISKQLEQLKAAPPLPSIRQEQQRQIERDVNEFDRTVAAVLNHIGKSGLRKVVLADVMDVVAHQPFNSARSLQTLRQNHPDCTVFSVSNHRGQSFIGASPEHLLSIQDNRLTTDALAGSAPRGISLSIDTQLAQTLLSSQKERYEHKVVVDFLLAQLRSLGLNPQSATTPQIMRLFHIQHLHTPISATLNNHPLSPLEILAKLHPTPAVAGSPTQPASQLIQQFETFDRGPYAAPLGWIDTEGNSEFIVGIRSALIDGCKARLYAGAGIVSGSEPAKELAEIKLKLQSLLNALR